MEKKDIIELKIEDMLDDGRAFGRYDGVAVFVNGGILGDTIHAEITKIKKSFAEARFLGIVEPSPNRIEAECPYASECGGCSLQELDYDAQIELKKNQVLSKLERLAGIENPTVDEIIPAKNRKYYRNKATFAIGPNGEVGFYKNKTHYVLDIDDCMLQSDPAMIAAEALRHFLSEHPTNCIKQMTVKTAFATGEVMVVLESDKKEIPYIEELVELLEEVDTGTGSLSTFKLASVAIIHNNKSQIVAGLPTITDELVRDDGKVLKFEIGPQSFYQVNPEQMQRLYTKAAEYAALTGNEMVLDLYCGIGTIGLFMADQAEQIIGIESVKPAVIDANRNAVINGIINARYFAGKAEEKLPELNMQCNVAIVDPPRAGCDEKLLETLVISNAERIVYVSCDAGTLARDVKYLAANGYAFDRISIVDQFPWTNHVESVALLAKQF